MTILCVLLNDVCLQQSDSRQQSAKLLLLYDIVSMATEEEWEEVDSSESGSSDEMTSAMDMEEDTATDNNNFVSRHT